MPKKQRESNWGDLCRAARAYVEVIEEIEKTFAPKKLQILEEKRVELHWKFIDILKREGVKYKDRDHATQIAYRIASRER